jgi:molybdopterin converting factor small subunit
MPVITVRFYSLWRQHLGTDRVAIEADNLDDALTKLEDAFGPRLRERLEAAGIHLDGRMQDHSLILLNGVSLRSLKSPDLKEGDVLHIFPPALGG